MEELNDNVDRNERNIKSWIGVEQDVIYSKMQKNFSFNIWSAIFLGLYFLYRKMYLIGAGMIIIQSLITKMVDTSNILWQVIFRLIFGASFYPIYKWHIQRKIRKLENNNYTDEQIIEIAKKKGGRSIGAALLFPVICIVLILVSMAIIMLESGGVIGGNTSIYNGINNTIINKDNVIKTYSVDNVSIEYNEDKWKERLGNNLNALVNNNIFLYMLENYSMKFERSEIDFRKSLDRYEVYNTFKNSNYMEGYKVVNISNNIKQFENGIYYFFLDVYKNEEYVRMYILISTENNSAHYVYVIAPSKEDLNKSEGDVMELLETVQIKVEEFN